MLRCIAVYNGADAGRGELLQIVVTKLSVDGLTRSHSNQWRRPLPPKWMDPLPSSKYKDHVFYDVLEEGETIEEIWKKMEFRMANGDTQLWKVYTASLDENGDPREFDGLTRLGAVRNSIKKVDVSDREFYDFVAGHTFGEAGRKYGISISGAQRRYERICTRHGWTRRARLPSKHSHIDQAEFTRIYESEGMRAAAEKFDITSIQGAALMYRIRNPRRAK